MPDPIIIDRTRLYDEVWQRPMTDVAKDYGLSDVGLAKLCKRLKIPRPPRGYWAKRQHNKPLPKRPPLPELPDPPEIRIAPKPPEEQPINPELHEQAERMIASLRLPENRIHVPASLRNPHPLVAQTRKVLSNARPD